MKPRTPTGFDTTGAKLWTQVVTRYALRPDELRILEDACRLADVATRLEDAMADQPILVKGSTGQPAVNPILAEMRAHRAAVASMLRGLKLPDELTDGAGKPNAARAAAQTRWANAHGKGPA